MIQIIGDIWTYHEYGLPIVITTNGDVNSRGECVMGRGVALQTKQRYPEFPKRLAEHIHKYGNRVGYFKDFNIFTFPTKHHWFEKSDPVLIEQSARHLDLAANWMEFEKIYMVRPGCSNGKLHWSDVEPILEDILDDRYIIVQN